MSKFWRIFWQLLLLVAAATMAWYFSDILVSVFLAVVLAIIGLPLLRTIEKIQIKEKRIPHGLASLITIVVIIILLSGMLSLLAPIILTQIQTISTINFERVGNDLSETISHLEHYVRQLGLIPSNQSLSGFINEQLKIFVSFSGISSLLSTIISNAGSFFLHLSIVLFLAFFFIKDKHLIRGNIQHILPRQYASQTISVFEKVRFLLSHYFLGVLLEMTIMMVLISVSLWILGVKNALIIGVFGGFMNVIPYLGPLLGATISCIFGIFSCLPTVADYSLLSVVSPDYSLILPTIIKIIIVFVGANLIDGILLQPVIYSKSIKAHPVEIFLVIIMAGSLGGIFAMVLAIPVYTVVRITAIEIYSSVRKPLESTSEASSLEEK